MPNHSVLIVGAGISGMRAALAAKERGSDVALISKVHPLRTHAGTSQGGINAAVREEDSAALHAEDTVKGGDYLADQNVVELLTATAPRAVITLDHWGVPFNRNGNGRLDSRRLCGATHPRACFVDDMTGHAILQVLHEQLLKAGIRTYEEWVVTRLLLDDGACVGVVALELASGKVEAFVANAVVLATGGCARVYEPTGAAYGVTGDGIALAYRAGAPLMDMEMVQFHPLGIKGSGMILTEALLGLGGYLANGSGERFALKHAPAVGERAPRDIVARAAEEEIVSGRAEFVALDLRHLDGDDLKRRLSLTSHVIKTQAGVDPAKETVPVRPVAHRTMGGLQVSPDGVTGVVISGGQVRYQNRRRDTFVLGVSARMPELHNMDVDTGRFLSDEDGHIVVLKCSARDSERAGVFVSHYVSRRSENTSPENCAVWWPQIVIQPRSIHRRATAAR